MINIFPALCEPNHHRWYWCYLDGDAEKVFDQQTPDLCEADVPMPGEGIYFVMVGDQPGIAVIAPHLNGLGGRIALISDARALKHALTPEDWR
jgi:hypothetical protein